MMFPPCKLRLRMVVGNTMKVAKIFENLPTSSQIKREVTIRVEIPFSDGLLQVGLDGLELRMAPIPTRILMFCLCSQRCTPKLEVTVYVLNRYSVPCNLVPELQKQREVWHVWVGGLNSHLRKKTYCTGMLLIMSTSST